MNRLRRRSINSLTFESIFCDGKYEATRDLILMPQLLIVPFITLPRKKWKNQLEKKTRVIVEYEERIVENDEGGDQEVPRVRSEKPGAGAIRGRDYSTSHAKSSRKSVASMARLQTELSLIIHCSLSILHPIHLLACRVHHFHCSNRFCLLSCRTRGSSRSSNELEFIIQNDAGKITKILFFSVSLHALLITDGIGSFLLYISPNTSLHFSLSEIESRATIYLLLISICPTFINNLDGAKDLDDILYDDDDDDSTNSDLDLLTMTDAQIRRKKLHERFTELNNDPEVGFFERIIDIGVFNYFMLWRKEASKNRLHHILKEYENKIADYDLSMKEKADFESATNKR